MGTVIYFFNIMMIFLEFAALLLAILCMIKYLRK